MNEIAEAYKLTATKLLQDPDDPEQLANQFTLLSARGRGTANLTMARRCAAVAPKEFIAVFNLASAELKAGLYKESIEGFKRALNMAPPDRVRITMQHIGLAWYASGDPNEALRWYEKARELQGDTDIRQSIAIARLMAGDLTAMFDFECKYHTPRRKPIAESGVPRWMGQDLAGKTIIVAHEQGYGDTIQFARFIPELNAGKVIWSGPPSISGLMTDNFAFDEAIGEDGPFEADYYCSPISICGALKVDYASVDPGPYLKAAPFKLPGKLKVGLAWAGNEDYAHDAERSMALEHLLPLLELPGTQFYSFQVGRGEEDITRLGLDGLIANLGGTFKDWRDTARAAAAMDLMVTVDSGGAHVSGALGRPTFVLLPYANCWRWMRHRVDSPWYASAKLFRQFSPGDWAVPVMRIKAEIEGMLNAKVADALPRGSGTRVASG